MSRTLMRAAIIAALLSTSTPAFAEANSPSEIETLKTQMTKMQERLNQLEQAQNAQAINPSPASATGTQSNDNAFNPAIGAVLNGHYAAFSGHQPTVTGFAIGEEGKRPGEGLALDEAEINFKSNVDDKFTANLTVSLSEEDGETSVELEEANIRTIGLPGGLALEAGRFLVPIGYLNEHHAHTDDFTDRPLPNRVFLNAGYKDDGVLASWLLPTPFYSEVGAGIMRGNDFPGGGLDGADPGAWTAYGKVGGDIGDNQNWLLGLSTLQTRTGQRSGNDGSVLFQGNSDLYAASLRYIWNPTGNAQEQEVTLQGEYFWRNENGTYDDTGAGTGPIAYSGNQSGWYAQGVYKFAPQWSIGTRYSQLNPDTVPAGLAGTALDAGGHDPWNAAIMGDWKHSEFSRVRLQYAHEEPSAGNSDDQIILQYIMSIGAHPAHAF